MNLVFGNVNHGQLNRYPMAQGLITQYEVLQRNPGDVESCKREGVQVVCIPQRGGKKTPQRETFEKSPDFKKGQRFRAGIEGRIFVLFRGRGMKRCLAEGRQRFEVLVGAAVLANNLMRISAMLSKRSSRGRRAA
jgi:IS5 family transposase